MLDRPSIYVPRRAFEKYINFLEKKGFNSTQIGSCYTISQSNGFIDNLDFISLRNACNTILANGLFHHAIFKSSDVVVGAVRSSNAEKLGIEILEPYHGKAMSFPIPINNENRRGNSRFD